MLDPISLHDGALAHTGRIVAHLHPDQLSLPTPCAEWDVRHLIDHLVEGNQMFTAAVTGEAPAVPADDPLRAYARSTEAVGQAWRQPGVLERMVALPFGTIPGFAAVRMHFVDHLVHGWDLARATGQDTSIDEDLAGAAYEEMIRELDDESRGPGGPFAPEVPSSSDAPIHERLVAFLGRRP